MYGTPMRNTNIEVNSAEYFYHGLNSGTQFFKKELRCLYFLEPHKHDGCMSRLKTSIMLAQLVTLVFLKWWTNKAPKEKKFQLRKI